jgi:guanylate kinase
MLLVVSGPSGVGKGAVTKGLLRLHPEVRKSVSWTTRPPRPEEKDGEDYVFVSEEQFREHLQAGGFLEWAKVHRSWLYGTPAGPVRQALAEGTDIILEIDCQGARSVRSLVPLDAVLVFIAPPTWQALVDRLTARDTEVPEQLQRRLASARRELSVHGPAMGMFQYVVVNDKLQQAVDELTAILIAERQSAVRAMWREFGEELLREADRDG